MSRSFQPLGRLMLYRGGTRAGRFFRRVRSWAAGGLRLFGTVAVLWTSSVRGNPVGEQVVGGAATFNRPDAATLIVNQQTDRAVINWNNFSIANGELTRFVQPSSTSAALNRVVTLTPSLIDGALQANGQVWLSNPNGIMVGKGGTVNVGSFVASTHDIATDDFMRGGDLTLRGNSDAAILNQGHIEAKTGDVYLVAKEVKNDGQLMARDGTVGMVSGTEVSLQAVGQGNFKIRLLAAENESTTAGSGRREAGAEAEIVNEGVIQAANAVLEAKGSYLPMAIKNTGLIEATGIIHNADGTVTLTGGEGDILNTGVVAALQRSLDGQKETGGSIMMAGKNVTSGPGSIITAAGKGGGGTVKLRAADTTILRGSIEVVGTSESAKGGQVQLLGERVGLFDQARVDASGGAGGGEVLVGGDYLGKNSEVPNAKAVVMAPTAAIRADATAEGNGGKVILWSDDYTAFFGGITALGGNGGGNGGFVETSSAKNLQAFGSVNASARNGNPGLWLLDPGSITIDASDSGTPAGTNPETFTGPATVGSRTIEDALNKGTSVTIQTGNDGTEYTITLNVGAPIQKTLDNAATLTLLATGGITLNSAISSTSNELYMVFNADVDNDGGTFILDGGILTPGATGSLSSNGGNVQVTASDVVLTAGSSITTTKTLSGGGTIAGDVLLQPSLNGATGRTVGIGSGAGTFSVSNAEIGRIANTGTALSGTITIGNRSAGNVTMGTGTPVSAGSRNVSIITGGTILDDGATTSLTTTGLLTLSSAGNIGGNGAANVLNLSVPRLAVITEGDLYNISTTATLTQFNVTTDGTVSSQTIRDNSAGTANLSFSVTESATTGNTTINTLSVNAGSVDFYYENTGLGVQGGGDITIGAVTLAPAGIRNVQAALLGYASLNNTYRDLEIRAPRGTLTVNTPIFSGGGNITLAALDFVGIAPDPTLPATAATNPNDYFASAAVINTFRSTSSTALATATFGARQTLQGSLNGISGVISGQGGMLTLEPTSLSATGRDVVLSRFDAPNIYPNTFNLSWDETTMLEAPAIRIGGPQAGDIRIQPLNEFAGGGIRTLTLTTINTPPTANTITTVTYVPRYFEQPFFDADRNTTTPRQPSSGPGVPHVAGGFVSFVSALGEVRNLPGGDVNIGTLSMTGVDGVFFDGRGGGNYAETDGATATGSLVGALAGRVGRTVQGVTVGNGGDYTVYLPVSGIDVEDARNVTGVSSLVVPQSAAAAATITGGAVSALNLDTVVSTIAVTTGGSYETVPAVTISGGGGSGASATADMGVRLAVTPTIGSGGSGYTAATVTLVGGGGSGATATATVTGGAVTAITITSSGSGYTEIPEIVIDGDGTGANATLVGTNPLTVVGVNLLSPGTGFTSNPTVAIPGGAVLAAATAATTNGGGGSYNSSPVVTLYGGGIQLGSARALLDEATLSSTGTSGVISVVPQVIGVGYTSAPTVTISDPLGIGSGATATAFINPKGQLTPFEVSALGDGYTAPPTVTLTGGGGSGAVARAEVSGYVKQSSVTLVGGTGYTSTPTVTISGGNGFGATATATVVGGVVTAITITDPGYGYTAAPVITITGGGGTGASATVKIGQGVTGLYIVDSGSGYTSAPTVSLSGGGGTGASATFNSAGFFTGVGVSGFGLSPIRVTTSGSGYTTAPEVSLSGGGIAIAQARAIFDNVPTSATFGQVRGYEITDPGAGYKSAPFVSVGAGTAFGNFGEYGVSTEQVDRNRASGNIVLDAFDTASQVVSGLVVNAPVRTGNAYGVNGTSAITGSILLDAGTGILANSDRGADGVLITGDAVVTGGSGSATTSAQSGSITLGAYSIANTDQSAVQRLSGSLGLPVQIGTASGGNSSNLAGALQAALFDRTTAVGVGNLQIYAPAPGQIEAAQGGLPLDPNHPARPPRSSNDLALSGLATLDQATDALGNTLPSSSLVTVEVGGFEGKLTLQRYANSSATATINEGQVTLITPTEGGALYTTAPTVQISGGGVVQAEGSANISGGQVTSATVSAAGSGYGNTPAVTITGGGGSGATATATVANGVVTGITIVNKGYGYTSLPTVTIGPPSGTQATATATTGDVNLGSSVVVGVLGIQTIQVTSGGTGYLFAPSVTISDSFGLGQGASAVANVSNGTVTSITVTAGGLGYVQPVITIGPPASIAQATANLTDGQVTSFTITNPGGGYASAPQVRLITGGTDPYNLDTDRVGLYADRIQLFDAGTPSSLQITAGIAAVGPFTNQRPVNLGNVTPDSTSFQNTDIARFAVGSLVLGRRQADQPSVGAGVITISQALSPSTTAISDGIILAGTRGIQDAGGTTGLSFENVVLDAGATVSLTGTGNSSHYFSGIIRDSGLAAGASFSVSSGLKTSGTSILPFTISEVFVNAAEFTGQRFYQGITTQNGNISIFADQIQQTPLVGFLDTTGGGTIPVSTSTVTLAPLTAGTPINLYATSQASGSLGLRIGNAQNPGLELIRAKTLTIGSSSAGAITLNSNLEFNYLNYPQAPFQVNLISGSTGSITAGTSQSAGAGTSRIRVGALAITDGGTVSLTGANDVDELAATITGSGSFSFTDIDGIRLGAISVANALTITAGTVVAGAITQTTDGITVGGISSFTTSTATGGQAITLTTASNNFGGAVNLTNAGAFNVAITDVNTLTLGTLTIPGGNLTATSTGALNLGAGVVGGNLTANSNGGAISQTGALTINGTSSITAGAAAINLANGSNNFVGTVTLINSGAANGITLSDGAGNLTIGNVTSAGAVSLTATGAGGTLLFSGAYGGLTGSLAATAVSSTGNVNLTFNSAMTAISSATLQTDGTLTLGAGANLGNSPGVPATTTTTSISVTADSLAGLGASLTAQSITLQPFNTALSLGLNNAAAGFNVPASLLTGGGQRIFARDSLILGSTSGIGEITIGNDGVVDLSSQSYGLTLRGLSGGVTFANTLILPNDTTFDLSVGTSDVNGGGIPLSGIAVSIGGNGTISFGSVGNVNSFTGSAANLGTSNVTGNLDFISVFAGNLNVGQMSVGGTSTFTLPVGRSFTAVNAANAFTGSVTLAGAAGFALGDVAINNSKPLTLSSLNIGGNFTASGVGINGGSVAVGGNTTLTGGAGDVTLTDSSNSFVGTLSVASSLNASLFVSGNQLDNLGAVQATRNFALTTDAGTLTLPTAVAANNELSTGQIQNFSVGSLSLTAGSISVTSPFSFPNIQTLALNSTVGAITAPFAMTTGNLSLSSATSATLSAGNRIGNLGPVSTRNGNFTFVNVQGMNLIGTVSVAGTADLTVAGQFYNYSGQALPFAGTTGRAVVRSLSMMGGMPNQISALAGFTPSYNFTDPGTSRAMIYAVSPMAQKAPRGTVIAGVDLGGTPTGGGQFNTFVTGSDNLNWMISDFGRFNLPKVDPARLEYMLYPQRVEPETKSLPQPVMRELTKELGRPPTLEEVQRREIANRTAAQRRSGDVLNRSSFDEDETIAPQQEAKAPAPVIDGGKPQAKAEGDSRRQILPHQVSNQVDTKRDPSAPMLRVGAKKAVVMLRTEEKDVNAPKVEGGTQASAKQIIEQERANAEVGTAVPVAGSK